MKPRRAHSTASPFTAIKPGDVVIRMLGGAPMALSVTAIDDGLIYCGGPGGWTFDLATGAEVDPELGWGPPPEFEVTGSYLLPPGEVDGDLHSARNPERGRLPARVAFRTETGSRYEVDNRARTWRRTPTLASGVLRSEEGSLLDPVLPIVGWPVVLIGPPNPDGVTNRVVVTTQVVAIESSRSAPRPLRSKHAVGLRDARE